MPSGLKPVTKPLLVFNLAMDVDDPNLSFASRWVSELAARVPKVDVVTMRVGRTANPENVRIYSVGKEQGYSEARRAVKFYRIMIRLVTRNVYGGCFAHMMPLFTVMAAPILRAKGIPVTLWYAHSSTTPILRLSELLSTVIVSPNESSFPLKTDKLKIIGHGIDTDYFKPPTVMRFDVTKSFNVCSVSRISRVKRLEDVLRAVELLHSDGYPVNLRVVGPIYDEQYFYYLRRVVGGIQAQVTFTGPQDRSGVRAELLQAHAFVNTSDTDSLDKSPLEAMSSGLPVISTNYAVQDELRPVAPWACPDKGDISGIKASLKRIRNLTPRQRQDLGKQLRTMVTTRHSIQHQMDRLVSVIYGGRDGYTDRMSTT